MASDNPDDGDNDKLGFESDNKHGEVKNVSGKSKAK